MLRKNTLNTFTRDLVKMYTSNGLVKYQKVIIQSFDNEYQLSFSSTNGLEVISSD